MKSSPIIAMIAVAAMFISGAALYRQISKEREDRHRANCEYAKERCREIVDEKIEVIHEEYEASMQQAFDEYLVERKLCDSPNGECREQAREHQLEKLSAAWDKYSDARYKIKTEARCDSLYEYCLTHESGAHEDVTSGIHEAMPKH